MNKSPSKNKVSAAPKMIRCKLFGHKWSMFRGFAQIHPHGRAKCKRCGVMYKQA